MTAAAPAVRPAKSAGQAGARPGGATAVPGQGRQSAGRLAETARPLGRLLAPVAGVVRPAGWVALGIAVVAFMAGLRFGYLELLAIAVALAAALVVAVAFVVGRSTYAVSVDLARLRVRVGTEAYGGLSVANCGSRSVLPSQFLLPVGEATAAFRVPRLAAAATHEEAFQVPTARRAVIGFGPVRSSRGDPLGLLRRDLVWTGRQELFVHPLTANLAGTSAGFLKDLEGRPTDDLSSSDVSFHALRDYVVGDDLRHIHWKTSARIGKLMVRQFEETRRSHLVVVLSQTPADYASEDAFELAVSVAASLGEQAIKEEKDVTVKTPTLAVHTETGARMLDDFSRLAFGDPVAPLEDVALESANAIPDASVAVLVTGSNATPNRLNAALLRFPVDVFTVAVRCEPGAGLTRRAIGDSPVLTVGELGDLPRALRSLGV
jgi:uncharacterized protein (DUF58 family)